MRNLFDDLGPLADAYDAVDWSDTPLGAPATWDQRLVDAVDTMLGTRFPVTLFWGPELTMIYNQAFVRLIADKHPAALGAPSREVFPEAWPLIGPMLDSVIDDGTATWVEDAYVPLVRRGFLEECYFTFSYSPMRDAGGRVSGAMDIATETTQQVISRRRLRLLSRLDAELAGLSRVEDVAPRALAVLRRADRDFEAVDIRVDGVFQDPSPELTDLPDLAGRDLGTEVVITDDLGTVASLPLATGDSGSSMLVRLSPMLAPDDYYLGFLRLVASTLRQSLDRVGVLDTERATTEAQRMMSEAFQRSLLPDQDLRRRPELTARYQPATDLAQIGGDWYDHFDLPDGSLSVVIGDIAGHDQQAAAAMAAVRNLLRGVAFAQLDAPPSRLLTVLDTAMPSASRDLVATAVLGRITRRAEGRLRFVWSNAGHPPPVLVDASGCARLLDTDPDLLLGLDATTRRVDHAVTLSPGDSLVLYTDGLVERRGTDLTDGLDWLVGLLHDSHLQSLGEIADGLVAGLVDAEDDVAVLVLRA